MKYYHLYEGHEGLQLGFLCIADKFEDAAASKLLEEGKVDASSCWLLSEPEVQVLLNSIHRECPDLKPIVVGMQPDEPQPAPAAKARLPEEFIKENLNEAKGMRMMDVPVRDLDEDSLMATLACIARLMDEDRKQRVKDLRVMTGLTRSIMTVIGE